MKKLLLLLIFTIKSGYTFAGSQVSQRDRDLAQNYILQISTLECAIKYKVPVSDLDPIFDFIIEKMYLDKDFWGLSALKNRLEKLRTKDNDKDINKLDFYIFQKLELLKK